jgi:hypothetical protein
MARRLKSSLLVLFLHLSAQYCSVLSVELCEPNAVPCPSAEESVCNQRPDCCFSMFEEGEVGLVVGNVNVVSLLKDILTNGTGSISQASGDEFFNLSTSTGEVSVRNIVDRDGAEGKQCITISIRATQESGVLLTTVGVIVEDINDNAPLFGQTPPDYSRPEGSDVSLCIDGYAGLEAIDIDSGQNADITYSLAEEGAGMFEINGNCIVNKVELDREAVADPSNTPEYRIQLTLIASDSELKSNNTLTIIVTDVNDNTPIFTESSLAIVRVREDEMDGIVIRDLNATDLDFNDVLTFSLETNGVPFALNEANGELSLAKSDGNISPGAQNLYITVSDTDGNTNRSTLTVDILDVNDKADITILTEKPLIEEMDPNHYLLRYKIQDEDENTEENYYDVQLSGQHAEYFKTEVVLSIFKLIDITLKRSIDQELIRGPDGNSIIELVIDIEEIGLYKNYTHQLFHNITVIGINDNVPFINKTKFYVPEESEMKIGDLEIMDSDSGINGTIAGSSVESAFAYHNPSSLTHSTGVDVTQMFQSLNPGNQSALISPSLDRDDGTELIIVTMKLTDGGGSSSYVNITVHLEDINDNCPVFANDLVIEFNEGEVDGVQGRVAATDADTGPNAEVVYELLNRTELFTVNSSTGDVMANGSFDRERKDNYALVIEARNSRQIEGPKCESSRIVVTVMILDVNDNDPVWENTGSTFDVFSDSAIGTLVITLIARDADQNPSITYEIEPNELFKMDERNGVISVAADLSDKVGRYDLTVTASDGERKVLRNITINVKTPEATSSLTQPVIIGITVGLCALLVTAILVTTAVILYCVYLEKKKQSRKIERNGRLDIDGVNSPARGILRPIPGTTGLNGRSSSSASGSSRVKFGKTVQEYGYDYESNGSGVYVTAIHLDSSGDESPVTPPRPPSAPSHHHHHNGKLPAMGRHAHTNGGPARLSPIHEDTLFHSYPYRPHPMQDDYSDDSEEGNSEDDESTLPDNASSTNAPLPNTRHLSHMASSPRSTPPNSHLGPHLPMAQISPSHQFTRSPDHGPGGLNPPHIDQLSVHSSSSDSLTVTPPPVHSHMSHENPRLRPPGRSAYPAHMPEGYMMPPSRYGADPFMGRYGGTDFGDASTYTSADLDDALHFNPDQEPGIYSLTATSSYDEDSQL